MNETESKRAKYALWAKVALIGLAGLAVAPFVAMAIGGLIGIAVAGLLGFAMISFSPLVSMKFANWKVKGIVSEAKENPIETMTNLIIAKTAAFKTFQTDVENDVAGFATFKQKAQLFIKRYPARNKEFSDQIEGMGRMVEQKKHALVIARDRLADADIKLEEMKAYWDMSQLAQKTKKSMGMSTGDAYEKLKADTAADAVFESVNLAFAQMEVASTLTLDNNPSQTLAQVVIASDAIEVQTKVLVK